MLHIACPNVFFLNWFESDLDPTRLQMYIVERERERERERGCSFLNFVKHCFPSKLTSVGSVAKKLYDCTSGITKLMEVEVGNCA